MDLALAAPQDFLAAPAQWMQWCSDFGATASAGPNFAYALAARALRRLSDLDLSPWRIALNGAEPIDPDAVDSFVAAGAPHGLRASSVFPAFGMAEATLAVTFPEPGSGLTVDVVDGRVLETEKYAACVSEQHASARRLARLGRPVAGLSVRVCEPAHRAGHARPRGRGDRDPRDVGDAGLLRAARCHRGRVARRLAAYRRPRIPRRRRARRVRAHQGRHHPRWSQRAPAGRRTRGREHRRRTDRQRDRVRHGRPART